MTHTNAMQQYIAFLRGINVGGHRVKMDRLRALFDEMGMSDVSTFIASGNVVFRTDSDDVDAVAEQIERHLSQGLGYDVPTFLRSPMQLDEIASFAPLDPGEGELPERSVYVILLRAPASDELRLRFAGLCTEMDEFLVSGTEVYWQIQGKISDSPLFEVGLKAALQGMQTTSRNLNTLRRLTARISKFE